MTGLIAKTAAFVLMAAGALFSFASVLGIIRFPDIYTRIHAGTKALSGGALLILAGASIIAPTWQMAGKFMLVAAFLLATNPVASHAIARASYKHGFKPGKTLIDEYQGGGREGR